MHIPPDTVILPWLRTHGNLYAIGDHAMAIPHSSHGQEPDAIPMWVAGVRVPHFGGKEGFHHAELLGVACSKLSSANQKQPALQLFRLTSATLDGSSKADTATEQRLLEMLNAYTHAHSKSESDTPASPASPASPAAAARNRHHAGQDAPKHSEPKPAHKASRKAKAGKKRSAGVKQSTAVTQTLRNLQSTVRHLQEEQAEWQQRQQNEPAHREPDFSQPACKRKTAENDASARPTKAHKAVSHSSAALQRPAHHDQENIPPAVNQSSAAGAVRDLAELARVATFGNFAYLRREQELEAALGRAQERNCENQLALIARLEKRGSASNVC